MRLWDKNNKVHLNSYWWLAAIIFLGFLLRIHLLISTNAVIDSDEAIVGLMAKHIVEGRPWPIFYYGQHYMGSLEPICVALLFFVFGVSNFALKAVPLVFSLVHIYLVYQLSKRFTDTFGARTAAFFAALGPSALILWSTKARGGFMEVVVLGTYALILCIDILKAHKIKLTSTCWLGFILGVGWWVNNQIIFYMVPIALVLAVFYAKKFRDSFAIAKHFLAGLVFFLIGGAPFWYANLFHQPQFASFNLFQPAAAGDSISYLQGFFTDAIPIILGARRFWTDSDVFYGSSFLAYASFVLSLAVVVYAWLWGKKDSMHLKLELGGLTYSLSLLFVFLLFVPLIFASSRYGWLSQAPRYLLPLYSVIFVFIGISVSFLYRSTVRVHKYIAIAMVLSLFLVQGVATLGGSGAKQGQPVVFQGERVQEDHEKLEQWLLKNNYQHVFTNYWVGYRLAFETKEQITFTHFGGPQDVRIKEYPLHGSREWENKVLVLTPLEADRVESGLSSIGYHSRRTNVGGYVVVDHILPEVLLGEKISLSGANFTFRKSRTEVIRGREHATQLGTTWSGGGFNALVDNDYSTRWATHAPQAPGMFLDYDFAKPARIAGIELDFGFWPHDYPRELSIELELANGEKCLLLDTRIQRGFEYIVARKSAWAIRFVPNDVKKIRLVLHSRDSIFDWSMAEFSVFAPR